MKLLDILADRAFLFIENSQERNLVLKLSQIAGKIIEQTSAHLDENCKVLGVNDEHNAEHSQKVLSFIEDLLGEKANDLSPYDLFSLIAVSYLHDCGMAVSEFEIEVLKMVEGKLDGEKLMTTTDAKVKIKENLDTIYGHDIYGFEGKINRWLFKPTNEEALIDYFAELLIDYQDYRNGRIDEINVSEDLIKTNNDLRIDYLRATHHLRIVTYLNNLRTTMFNDFSLLGIGRHLSENIAACCRAHGEDICYVTNLPDSVQYSIGGKTNLQFVAMMLRLGDIIHFSYDRAHPALRGLHQIQSELSFHHKNQNNDNGFSFIVNNGEIICNACCKMPKDYYYISHYVEAINCELLLFGKISSKWMYFPKLSIKNNVNTSDLDYDKQSFQLVPGLKFTLDQNKVLDLLMGTKLYTNEYACLRELYQNSLDACRCQIAKDAVVGRSSTGHIEFGLGEEKRYGINRKYVYCLDNGKGMTKEIIEKYLLHIGSSYYRSSDFFKKQAETGATFTPTSQFGIGLLSCFMIGDEIEITTLEEGSEVVSCVMERINEYFYYQRPKLEDEDKVKNPSGTLVKVFLNEKYQDLLKNGPLEELGYLLWYNESEPAESARKDLERWKHHLYQIMNNFILLVPNKIDVFISLQDQKCNNKSIKIYNKPLPISGELKDYAGKLSEVEGYYSRMYRFDKLSECVCLDIQVEENGLECRGVFEVGRYDFPISCGKSYCVDGISINKISDNSLLSHLGGILNFKDKNRPQLSVNREELINVSWEDYDKDARVLLNKYYDELIAKMCHYITVNKIQNDSYLYGRIWDRFFGGYSIFNSFEIYNCLKHNKDCHPLPLPFNESKSFGELLLADEFKVKLKGLQNVLSATVGLLPIRCLESDVLEFNSENELLIKGHNDLPLFFFYKKSSSSRTMFQAINYNKYWSEYDYVHINYFVFISDGLKNAILEKNRSDLKSFDGCIGNNYIIQNDYDSISYYAYKVDSELGKYLVDGSLLIGERTINMIVDDSFNKHIKDMTFRHGLKNIDEKVAYYHGMVIYTRDFSVLVCCLQQTYFKSICFARRGKCSRQELLDSISDKWKKEIKNVLFLDGTVWNADLSN